jgi:hypothetical protein
VVLLIPWKLRLPAWRERTGYDKACQFLTARYGSVGEAKNRLGSLPQIKAALTECRLAFIHRERTGATTTSFKQSIKGV